jgi:L-asparaginase
MFPLNTQAKNISIIAVGGTISGTGSSETNSQYESGQIDIEQIIGSVSDVKKLANLSGEQLMQIGSQDMNDEAWLKIAKHVNRVINKRSVDGIVITHGTDTMEETAYFLNLTIDSKKPIILTGAMRPSTSISADGPMNLYNAVALARSDIAKNKGVLVLMNGKIFAARDVIKTHTTDVAAFGAQNAGEIGFVHYDKVEIYHQPLRKHTHMSKFDISDLDKLPKVDVVFIHSNFDNSIIDHLIKSGTKAIITAGVGDGNVSKETVTKLTEARKKGVIIVRSSRVASGFVHPNVEINDDELEFVTADNLSPQKARILTMLALTKTDNYKEIQEFFGKY